MLPVGACARFPPPPPRRRLEGARAPTPPHTAAWGSLERPHARVCLFVSDAGAMAPHLRARTALSVLLLALLLLANAPVTGTRTRAHAGVAAGQARMCRARRAPAPRGAVAAAPLPSPPSLAATAHAIHRGSPSSLSYFPKRPPAPHGAPETFACHPDLLLNCAICRPSRRGVLGASFSFIF